MVRINILITVFIIMLLSLILSKTFFRRKNGGEMPDIQQSKIRNPRHLVKSFTDLFDKRWAAYDGTGKIFLSREENILAADGVTEYPPVCHSIVFAENEEFRPQPGTRFEKEVYCRQNAYLFGTETVTAICSKKNLVLGSGTQVRRWVDAEGVLTVHDDCDLGISASSATKIITGSNCRFRCLFAPVLLLGEAPEEQSPHHDHSQNVDMDFTTLDQFQNIKYVDDDLADATGIVTGSIITKHDITVLNYLIVKGHISSRKAIRLCDHAVVYGNLTAEGDIYLGAGARVYGSVAAKGNLITECGVTIGQFGKTTAVMAGGNVSFDRHCRVYGYINSEMGGKCCPKDNLNQTDQDSLLTFSRLRPEKGNLIKKMWPVLVSAAMLFAVIGASLISTATVNKIQEKDRLLEERQAIAEEPTYGEDGKPGGGQLDTEPTVVTKEHVYFTDRVLERFQYDAQDILLTSQVLSSVMQSLPQGVNKYLMLVPTRISFEGDRFQSSADDISRAIAETYAGMPSNVVTIDVAGALLKHKDDYLFFRTEFVWTALGAYYAAEQFGNSAGIELKDIGEYREKRPGQYIGTFRVLPYAHSLGDYPDYISYYILQGAANEQTKTARCDIGEYDTYQSPTVAQSRPGYNIFIGSHFSHSILSGDADNGKTLMIVGDEYSKAFAPWLTPYYKNVLLVNPKYFNGGSKEFWQLFSEYEISDFLIMEYVQNMGDSIINARIREIAVKP